MTRANVDTADAVLLLIGFGIALMVMQVYDRRLIAFGAIVAYAGLIIALAIVPRQWINGN